MYRCNDKSLKNCNYITLNIGLRKKILSIRKFQEEHIITNIFSILTIFYMKYNFKL